MGLSGLALYAVVAAHADPPAEALDRAVAFLLRQQAANGRLGPESVDDLYNHAPATLALQAVLASHPVPELAAAVRRAVDHVVVRQGASGGWGYADTPSSPNTVISGWPLEVLLRARAAGRGDLEEPIARARAWLASMVDRSGRAGYDRRGAFPQGVATPTAIVVGLDPEARWPGDMDIPMDLFGIYFLSANAGNNDVKMSIRRRLGDLQSRSGANAGSFLPSDRWSADGGRIYATAMGVLSWSRL